MLKHLQSYVVHYAAVLAGLCLVVSKLDPSLLGPYSGLVGAAAIGVTIAHALGIKPETLGKVSVLILLAAPLTMLCSCAQFQSFAKKGSAAVNSPTTAPLIASGVELAVGTEIALVHKTPADQAAAAARYIAIAQALEALDSGDVVTLAQLESAASAKIDAANIPPPDKLAAKNLIAEIAAILLQETQAPTTPTGTQPLAPDMKVAVKSVLDDVILAAGTYQVHARAVLRAELAPQ